MASEPEAVVGEAEVPAATEEGLIEEAPVAVEGESVAVEDAVPTEGENTAIPADASGVEVASPEGEVIETTAEVPVETADLSPEETETEVPVASSTEEAPAPVEGEGEAAAVVTDP